MPVSLLSQAKPCPFCEGMDLWFWEKARPGWWAVGCSNPTCGATGPFGQSDVMAVILWNRAPRVRGFERPHVERVIGEQYPPGVERELDPQHWGTGHLKPGD